MSILSTIEKERDTEINIEWMSNDDYVDACPDASMVSIGSQPNLCRVLKCILIVLPLTKSLALKVAILLV